MCMRLFLDHVGGSVLVGPDGDKSVPVEFSRSEIHTAPGVGADGWGLIS